MEVAGVVVVDMVNIQHMEFLLQAHQVINSLVRLSHNKLNSHKVDTQVAVDGINLHHHQQQLLKVKKSVDNPDNKFN